jgi:hypothetical protein
MSVDELSVLLRRLAATATPSSQWAQAFADAIEREDPARRQLLPFIADLPADSLNSLREACLGRELPDILEGIAVATAVFEQDQSPEQRSSDIDPASRQRALAFLGWSYDRMLPTQEAAPTPPALDHDAARFLCAWFRYLLDEFGVLGPHDPCAILRVRPEMSEQVRGLERDMEHGGSREVSRALWRRAFAQVGVLVLGGLIGSAIHILASQVLGDWSFLASGSIALLGSIIAINNVVRYFSPLVLFHHLPAASSLAVSFVYSVIAQLIVGLVAYLYDGSFSLAELTGFGLAVLVNWVVLYWTLRSKCRLSIRELLTPDIASDPTNPMAG